MRESEGDFPALAVVQVHFGPGTARNRQDRNDMVGVHHNALLRHGIGSLTQKEHRTTPKLLPAFRLS
jgi:hypothetical protein